MRVKRGAENYSNFALSRAQGLWRVIEDEAGEVGGVRALGRGDSLKGHKAGREKTSFPDEQDHSSCIRLKVSRLEVSTALGEVEGPEFSGGGKEEVLRGRRT